MFWGGTVFTAGWVMRAILSYNPSNLNLYIAQQCLILAGPPIFAAAEYNILGRMMYYLPMHAPLHPGRLVYFFIYLGAGVEGLTGAGASLAATSTRGDLSQYKTGSTLISIALVLQAAVECVFISVVALMHQRAARAHMLSRNVRMLCVMLYGTSTLILIRCIFRAIESFATLNIITSSPCTGICRVVSHQEWYLYVFEAVPMALYTIWLNVMHPGRYLQRNKCRYLDIDGKTERLGPGWIDQRPKWKTFVDPMDLTNTLKGEPKHEKFWLYAEQWPVASGGSLACGTASNTSKALFGRKDQEVAVNAKESGRE